MALIELAKINDNSFWAAWKVEESTDDLIAYARLNEEERAVWRSIHHAQKQVEWLSSRAALASILAKLDVPPQTLRKDDKGKPFLADSSHAVSLAHAYPYGVAILHQQQAVGIDIERPSDKLRRIQHKFLNESEMRAVDNRAPQLCLYWCIKETLYKLYGRKQLSLKDNIRVHLAQADGVIRAEASIVGHPSAGTYRLEGTILEDFFVVYSVV